MSEVKQSSWFQHQLPDGALTMNDFYITTVPFLDQVGLESLLLRLGPTQACLWLAGCACTRVQVGSWLQVASLLNVPAPWNL